MELALLLSFHDLFLNIRPLKQNSVFSIFQVHGHGMVYLLVLVNSSRQFPVSVLSASLCFNSVKTLTGCDVELTIFIFISVFYTRFIITRSNNFWGDLNIFSIINKRGLYIKSYYFLVHKQRKHIFILFLLILKYLINNKDLIPG